MKKIVTYLLIATLAFSLIGCAEADDRENPSAPSQGASQEDENKDAGEDNKEDDSKEGVKEDKVDNKEDESQEKADKDEKGPEKGEDKSDNGSQGTEVKNGKGTLYFSDENAEYLNAEERELDELTPESLINALIEGPKEDANRKTIPDGTKLIDVKVEDGVAYVNFSKEFKENHWGGSTGETHTIYSIVNTLALNPDLNIDSVKILVDGETIESLSGHMDTTEPIEPDLELSKHK